MAVVGAGYAGVELACVIAERLLEKGYAGTTQVNTHTYTNSHAPSLSLSLILSLANTHREVRRRTKAQHAKKLEDKTCVCMCVHTCVIPATQMRADAYTRTHVYLINVCMYVCVYVCVCRSLSSHQAVVCWRVRVQDSVRPQNRPWLS